MGNARTGRLRAVFFDAGNTLIRMNYAAIASELARRGVAVTADQVQRAEWRARVRLDDEVFAPASGRTSTESRDSAGRYVRLILETLGVGDEAVIAGMAEWRRTHNPPVGPWDTPDPGAAPALDLLRRAGVGAAVVSNSNGSIRGIVEALGLAGRLDFVIDSSVVGVEKPDPRIFALALDRAGVDAGEAAYVGDLYSVDVCGARAAGLTAVLLDPGGHWGERGCPRAPDVLAAVRQLLAGSVTPAG